MSDIEVPASFLAMPRWWTEGDAWLQSLPELVAERCDVWGLVVDGAPLHGSNALVVPVVRGSEHLVLRLSPPDAAFAAERDALRFWAGRGTVMLVDDDSGALLLERLDTTGTLADEPLDVAMDELGRAMRRLAVAAPAGAPCTADLVRERLPQLEQQWDEVGRPFERALLDAALDAGSQLQHTATPGTAVNGDLHADQVLRGIREPWLVVDPQLLRGDIEYDLARALFTRVDDMQDAAEILDCFRRIVVAAGIDERRAWSWALYRTVDYWLWALSAGLTIDPERCRRVAGALLDSPRIQEHRSHSGDPA